MPSFGGLGDFYELAKKLKHEKLFISNERREIEQLNRKVHTSSTMLLHSSWLAGSARLAMENLTALDQTPPSPLEAHRHLSHKQFGAYSELIQMLRAHPDIVGLLLTVYEGRSDGSHVVVGETLKALLNIYGGLGGPLPDDGQLLLKLLSVLAGQQILPSATPRRVLRQSSSPFSSVYRLIAETLPSSRLFLIGALHSPLCHLLASDDLEVDLAMNKDMAAVDRTEKVARVAKMFLDSVMEHMAAFPPGLTWLVQSIHSQLSLQHSARDVSLVCTDLVWALFICPAVANPEPFGVTDAPVGGAARHLLSQAATLLQALALYKWEGGADPRFAEFASYFDLDSLPCVLDTILSLPTTEPPPTPLSALTRRSILLPESQLEPLLSWLREALLILERSGKLTDIEIWPALVRVVQQATEAGVPSVQPQAAEAGAASPRISNRTPNRDRAPPAEKGGVTLIFPTNDQPPEWVGLLPESEVIAKKSASSLLDEFDDVDDESGVGGEKRTRFSISQDEGSVGTSDNQEVISEAASTHSASSSIELDADNLDRDNLSDMLSANVSGRGTPNVSGRNTPTEEPPRADEEDSDSDVMMREEEPPVGGPRHHHHHAQRSEPAAPSKQQRSEIEDKFCKFEIRKMLGGGDETISLVSDTWSTDVLASDSEFGDRLPPLRPDATVNADTMSEAWSTDVGGTSEVERLQDFDVEEARGGGGGGGGGGGAEGPPPVNDTPRSSVSGSNSNSSFRRSHHHPVDLLLFDEPEPTSPPAPMEVEKPPRHTPKSISFDKTAERGDRADQGEAGGEAARHVSTPRSNFFRNFRLPFRGSGGSGGRSARKPVDDNQLAVPQSSHRAPIPPMDEDILAKYRRKPSDSTDGVVAAAQGLKLTPMVAVSQPPSSSTAGGAGGPRKNMSELRRKLRAVLGSCELEAGGGDLGAMLRAEAAAAIARGERAFAAQCEEAERGVKGVTDPRKLLRQLKDDYRRRSDYVSYLIRAKQGLLSTLQSLERATARSRHEAATYAKFVIGERVRLRLEEEKAVVGFVEEFRRAMLDEKVRALEGFLSEVERRLMGDCAASELPQIREALEQNIVARIYQNALYPNGEADVHRDTVLTSHITHLSPTITPTHPALRIPRSRLAECPWPSAQRELRMLSAYRTAGDKLRCVVTVCSLIVGLLGGGGGATVAADDFVPVLVFVVIKANPSALLSTIQYVNSFYGGGRLCGEDEYWWTQFCSAVEFIKTMEYGGE